MTFINIMPRVLALSFLFTSPCAIIGQDIDLKPLATPLAETIKGSGKLKVAVVDFVDLNNVATPLGKFIAEELSIQLAMKGLKVVDRGHLKTLLEEIKLDNSGLIDPSSAKQLGQLAGVDIIVTGSVTDLGKHIRIGAKGLTTNTGDIVAASAITIEKSESVKTIMNSSPNPTMKTKKSGDGSKSQIDDKPARAWSNSALSSGVRLKVEVCKATSTGGYCKLSITVRSDGYIYMTPREVSITSKTGATLRVEAVTFPGSASYDHNLVGDVPTGFTVAFSGESGKQLAMLHFDFQYSQSSNGRATFGFRNVPIESDEITSVSKPMRPTTITGVATSERLLAYLQAPMMKTLKVSNGSERL